MEDWRGLQLIYGPKSRTLGLDAYLGVGALHRLTPRGGSFVGQKEQSYSRTGNARASVLCGETISSKVLLPSSPRRSDISTFEVGG